MQRRARGYSLLMVLMMLGLLAVAIGGLFAVILRGGVTSGAMLDRRTTFYACDGMGRQLASLGQAFLSRNTLEDVPESVMQRELREVLPLITPTGFVARPADLVIPERALPDPAPIEVITTGPFAGLEVKLQLIDMRFSATRTGSGAVCRTEQTLSLGRIALFQFFVFADLPLLDIVPPGDDPLFLRGRIHTNGRTCLGGRRAAPPSRGAPDGPFTVRLDANMTAVDRILRSSDSRCDIPTPTRDVGVIGKRARGPARPPPAPDRLLDASLLEAFSSSTDSGCTPSECPGGWRSFAINVYANRMQDRDHEVQELTLPVDPPEMRSQRGWTANGPAFTQQMKSGTSRPNTRFLVEPALTNDPTGFARNKLSFKAQIRIIDGVWYVKDPGANNDTAVDGDDGPWPGIAIWSDHPGEFTTGVATMGAEGVEGAVAIAVGQSDIRARLDASTDARLLKAQWSKRALLRASPTPRRFSYYGFVDRTQSALASTSLSPPGMGLQYGRLGDVDPPAVISYGAITPVFFGSTGFFSANRAASGPSGPPTAGEQPYWLPGVRLTDEDFDRPRLGSYTTRTIRAGFCSGPSTQFAVDEVANNIMMPAVPQPLVSQDTDDGPVFLPVGYPAPNQLLPSDGTTQQYASAGNDGWSGGRICVGDNESDFRRRMRLALLESTRTGFADTHNQGEQRLNPAASNDVLPLNFNMHAFQEALADKTPGELGSYFCTGCLWEKFDGTIFVTNTWKGSMLGADTFPDGNAAPPANPVLDDRGLVAIDQPKAPKEDRSTTGPLPYPLCAADSDEEGGVALAQVVGHRFLESDEVSVRPLSAGTSLLDTTLASPFTGNGNIGGLGTAFRRLMPKHIPTGPSEAPTTQALPEDVAGTGGQLTGSFRIPDCADYSLVDGKLAAARPTSVRLINARTINFNSSKCGADRRKPCLPQLSPRAVGMLDAGINFVTNVPLYVVGDVNQSSEIDAVETGKKATDWVPVMLAGDSVTTLSNGWSDEFSRWGVRTENPDLNITQAVNRPAETTRYNMLLLTGINGAGVYNGKDITPVGRSGGGLPSAMRLMENWTGKQHIFRGAMVLGWMPVFTQWRVGEPDAKTFQPPIMRDWQFDRHLNATINQPPDSPVFDVTALRSWRRE